MPEAVIPVLRWWFEEIEHKFHLRNARQEWFSRRSLLIHAQMGPGDSVCGEAAPLENHSPDTLAACRYALEKVTGFSLPSYNEQPVREQLEALSQAVPEALPAARCALEMLLVDLWARQLRIPAARLLNPRLSLDTLSVAALLPEAEPLAAARAYAADGFTTFKLKVGQNMAREVELLAQLRSELGPEAHLRLDANQAWSAVEARRFCEKVSGFAIEFIEEPVPTNIWPDASEMPIPLACDESLLSPTFVRRLEQHQLNVQVMVLKPTLLGGLARCLRLAELAQSGNLEVVVSHLFEGPVGYATCVALAHAVQSRSRAAGLGPYPVIASRPEFKGLQHAALHPPTAPGLGIAALPQEFNA